MSSGFVSAGTLDNPTERDEEWRQAQAELAENRRRKEEASQQNEGKSLYEVLQANKAAKQDAFEEATRLKNQFRALDDDEAEFLDSVLESTRRKEVAVRKETLEQLDAFRRQQEEAERKALAEENAETLPADDAQWVRGGRKRKKAEKDGVLLKGVKLRKTSSSGDKREAREAIVSEVHGKADVKDGGIAGSDLNAQQPVDTPKKNIASQGKEQEHTKTTTAAPTSAARPANVLALGLGYASSDEDD